MKMANMKSSLAFGIFLIDLFGGISVLILSINVRSSQPDSKSSSQIENIENLRGSKLDINIMHSQEKKSNYGI
mgnify:CR=1 FL=1